ncbi:MAG: anti-sigma factor RsbA family regulatory protein [Solirubrobacteraceae bacterium]
MAGGSADALNAAPRGPRAGSPAPLDAGGFRHEAIFQADGDEGFLRETLPLIRQATKAGTPVMALVGEERSVALREALGASAARVGFADMRRLGSNPARIIPAWSEFLERHGAGGPAPLGIAEPVWAGRARQEIEEGERHEHLLNIAFHRGRGWRLVCAYDLDALEQDVLARALHSHPFILEPGAAGPNEGYNPSGAPRHPFHGSLPRPPGDAWEIPFSAEDLLELRSLVGSWAAREAMASQPAGDLLLAIHEIASNSIRHGGGTGLMHLWRAGEALICEIGDAGQIEDPMAGVVLPGLDPRCGRGIWIANQLCDLVQIRSSRSGTQVRLHKRLA